MRTSNILQSILLFIMNKIKKIRRFKTRAKPKRNISRQGQRNYLNNELNTLANLLISLGLGDKRNSSVSRSNPNNLPVQTR
ncbi:uncharacterized protein isoform X2 [Rhodnius prolixus]|uniref:uncharacterized protein isoform X2 n=1 Tax=Rhodnius prolixus TaxID=13249 RepID=UPI003D188F24